MRIRQPAGPSERENRAVGYSQSATIRWYRVLESSFLLAPCFPSSRVSHSIFRLRSHPSTHRPVEYKALYLRTLACTPPETQLTQAQPSRVKEANTIGCFCE
eukprot:3375518-Rhodomonas_salina.2